MVQGYISILFIIVVFVISFIIIYKRRLRNKLTLFFLALYGVSAVCSLFFYGLYDKVSTYNYDKISIFPFLYWLIIFYFMMRPIYQFDKEKTRKIKYDIKIVNAICILGLFFGLILFVELIPSIGTIFTGTQSQVYDTISEMHDTATEKRDLSSIGDFCLRMVDNLYELSFVMIFPLIRQKKKNYFAIAGVAMVLLTKNLAYVTNATRSGLFFFLIHVIFIIIIFWPFFIEKERMFFLRGMGGLFSIILIIFITITIARAFNYHNKNQDVNTTSFITQYAGEGFCNFNNYAFQAQEPLGGVLTLYIPRAALGIETPILSREYLYTTAYKLQKIPQNVFYTFIGTFVLDLGPVWGAVLLILLSVGMSYFVKKNWTTGKAVPLSNVYFFTLYTKILEYGPIAYPYRNVYSILLVHFIVIFLILRYLKT